MLMVGTAVKGRIPSAGGKARAATYQPAIDFACQQARETRPKINGWRSRNHAVGEIKKAVFAFVQENKIALTETSIAKRIDEWLAEMPDAAELFPPKRKKTDGTRS